MNWQRSARVMSIGVLLMLTAGWLWPATGYPGTATNEVDPADDVDVVPIPEPPQDPVNPSVTCHAAGAWPRALTLLDDLATLPDDVPVGLVNAALADVDPCAVIDAVTDLLWCTDEEECQSLWAWLLDLVARLKAAVEAALADVTQVVSDSVRSVGVVSDTVVSSAVVDHVDDALARAVAEVSAPEVPLPHVQVAAASGAMTPDQESVPVLVDPRSAADVEPGIEAAARATPEPDTIVEDEASGQESRVSAAERAPVTDTLAPPASPGAEA